MMDIVEKLRNACLGQPAIMQWPHRGLHEAADEIEKLRALDAAAYEAIDLYQTTGGGSPVAHAKFHKAMRDYLDLRNSTPHNQEGE